MKRIIPQNLIEKTVYEAVLQMNRELPPDVEEKIIQASQQETSETGRIILNRIIDNIQIARDQSMPICQDTGMIWCLAEAGAECILEGNLQTIIENAVAKAYQDGFFRQSVVDDPLFRRENTRTNTPIVFFCQQTSGDKLKISLLAKGFGSENTSRIAMLNPTAGASGVIEFIEETMNIAGGSPCPPVFLGIGIGGTMDMAAFLSKKALIRKAGTHHPDPAYANLEKEILQKVNELGIGPGGLGGKVTCLWAAIETWPTHIAGMPTAVTVNCWADRKASIEL